MKRALMLLTVLLCFVPFALGQGNVVYNNGAPNLQNGNEMTNWIQAEDFFLRTGTLITDVHFWTIEDPNVNGYAGSIWYGIYADAGGQPNLGAPAIESGFAAGLMRMPTGRVALGSLDEYAYWFNIVPFTAQAGVTYWLGLHNGDPNNNFARAEVYWETTDFNGTITGNEDILPPMGDGWFNNGQEHAFELTGTPEPSSLLLLGTGLAGLAAVLRRKLLL